MDNIFILLLAGFFVGTLGTLIGAGGGFILIPLLILTHPDLPPDIITAVSIAIVAANAISGSVAYTRSGRIDFRAGILFALSTIPGSILGVYSTSFIPKKAFHIVFGILLVLLAIFLFVNKKQPAPAKSAGSDKLNGITNSALEDKEGNIYSYSYNRYLGIFISIIVGFISPLLGIGGGIIHVPALVKWLNFPVYIATATSHFILAVMASVSVVTHLIKGDYNDPLVQRMVITLSIGAMAGAQLGALLSHKIRGNMIIRALAVCLAIVGARILLGRN